MLVSDRITPLKSTQKLTQITERKKESVRLRTDRIAAL